MKEFQLKSRSEDETREIAAILSTLFHAGEMIVLDGELGAGKTQFAKGFANALGCVDNVTSPTFSIANFYKTREWEILHVDLYRVETPEEYEALGLEDYFPRVVTLVEWGSKFPGYLDPSLAVSFARERGGDSRVLTITCANDAIGKSIERIMPRLTLFLSC
ncbi:MAG: tRNA (adenosine(37)-N6)-threonylcarbamoyltransferase complex ATPase subunit type 1 TsaE [Odoribacteraceae bacterium]|jgi:tRNA threonylcarbamoyladenosine biosynthesis protein TsaE|nr:tRNA (adenosine(37)-N6)-threonylcarbamoyltransferase complex ATPase subunit type 1 TsaE [Odoribacteraceae bacterium]